VNFHSAWTAGADSNAQKCSVFGGSLRRRDLREVWHAPCNIGWRRTGRKIKKMRGESTVSIQKKSLINTLKSAKKANVVKEDVTVSGATVSAAKAAPMKALRVAGKAAPMKALRTAGKSAPMKALRTARAPRAIKPE
jgi:hypothetical protein